MQICKQCGHENDDQAVFCANPNCGTFLQWTADDEAGTRIEGASAASTPVAQNDVPRGPRRRPPVEGSPPPRPAPVAGQPTDVPPDAGSTVPAEPPPSLASTGPRPTRPGAPRSPLSPSPTLASGEGEDATAQSRTTRARFLAARPGESRSAPQQTLVMEERPSAGVTVSTSPTECNVAPGESASCEILVRNTGTVVDQFTLQVEGDAAVWAVVEPPALNLYPGSEPGVSTLRFFPPRSPQTASGPARFALRATSREDPSVSATARGVLNVAPYYDLAAELVPHTSQGRRRAEHRFLVNNQGNTRMRAAVNATDPDNVRR